MTRAEQIRQMDDKELADFLCDLAETDCSHCKFDEFRHIPAEQECAAMKYLHEEVDE